MSLSIFSLSFLGPYHPQIVHTPIVMLIFSAVFALVARLFDRDWLKRTSVIMLVFGFLGAFAAVESGETAEKIPKEKQGVSEHVIDEHADGGWRVVYLAGAALVVMAIGSRLQGGAASALGILALLLQLTAAVLVGVTGKRGGELVFAHGAGVRVDGQLVRSAHAGEKPAEPTAAGEHANGKDGAER